MKLNILQLHQDNLRLRDSLYMARRTILKLLPEPLQAVLGTYEDCKTLSDAYRWEEEVIDRLLVLAKPRPAREMGDPWRDDQRACCPVCGEGVSDNFVPRLDITEARQESQIWTTFALSPYLRANDLQASVDNGKATLTGKVADDVDKDLAKQIALGVDGIMTVDNQIVVQPDYVPAKASSGRSFGGGDG